MIDRSQHLYDAGRGKRIARALAPTVALVVLVMGWRDHGTWWLILATGCAGAVASYWFWRGCDYLVYRLTEAVRSAVRDPAA